MLKQRLDQPRAILGFGIYVALGAILCASSPPTSHAAWPRDVKTVQITSSADGTQQPSNYWMPEEAGKRVPLLVGLHTWSSSYTQETYSLDYLKECRARGWAVIFPNFRGPNKQPEACGSDLALTDIRDAVDWMCERTAIDPSRIYVVGVSGGGHMALLCAARYPKLWAAVSSWVPPADLAAWHGQAAAQGRVYADHLAAVCGGAPGDSEEVDLEYRHRSPVHRLAETKDVRIEIAAGILDGHGTSVPISHTLDSFNVLARANGFADRVIPKETVDEMVATAKVPASLGEPPQDPTYVKPVLFRREAGPVRVTIFQGGHEIQATAAIEWLARYRLQTSTAGDRQAPGNYE